MIGFYTLSKTQSDIINKFIGMRYIYKSTVKNYISDRVISREDEQEIYDVFKNLKGDNFNEYL